MNADAQVVESWYTRAVEGRRAYAHAGSSPALGTIGLGEKNPLRRVFLLRRSRDFSLTASLFRGTELRHLQVKHLSSVLAYNIAR